MRLVPTFEQIADAQNAINAQHPSLSDDAPATTLANETDAAGRRVLRVTTQQLATLVHGLAAATRHRFGPASDERAAATCDKCKRSRCDCYDRECDKCHWPGSPNCRRAGRS